MSEAELAKIEKKEHRHHKDKSEKKDKKDKKEKKNEAQLNEDKQTESSEPTIPKFKFKNKSILGLPKEIQTASDKSFSISREFDGKYQKAAKTDIDRSYWETEVLRLHPELKDLISRVDPVTRAATLAGLFLPSRRLLPHTSVLALICQHLRTIGLPQTASEIQESFMFNIDYPIHKPNSQLVHHLERGIISADGFYNLLLPTPGFSQDPNDIKKHLTSQATTTLGVIGVKIQDDKKIIDDENLEGFKYNEETKLPETGTTNQLVWAAATRCKPFSPQMVDIFAMTYHTFMTSHTMLRKLQEALEKLQQNWEKNNNKNERDAGELMFVALVEKWIEISFYDFDTMLIQNLYQWILSVNFQNKAARKRLINAYTKQIQGTETKAMRDPFSTEGVKLPKNLFTCEFSLTEMDKTELAKQIIMYAGKYYYHITAKELLDCAWSKPRIKHRAPNVVGITAHFNKLNQFVQHEILFAETLKKRMELFSFFSSLAHTLWKMQDYFDGMAIATAFNANPIYRLKLHKQILDPTVMGPIDMIMHDARSEKNFAALLELHNQALNSKSGTVIPYVGVYLTQLTFFYDGNKDYIDGLVNYSKCAGIYQLVNKILSFQMKQFNFPVIDQVHKKIADLRPWDSATLSAQSMIIEPKDMTIEDLKAQLNP